MLPFSACPVTTLHYRVATSWLATASNSHRLAKNSRTSFDPKKTPFLERRSMRTSCSTHSERNHRELSCAVTSQALELSPPKNARLSISATERVGRSDVAMYELQAAGNSLVSLSGPVSQYRSDSGLGTPCNETLAVPKHTVQSSSPASAAWRVSEIHTAVHRNARAAGPDGAEQATCRADSLPAKAGYQGYTVLQMLTGIDPRVWNEPRANPRRAVRRGRQLPISTRPAGKASRQPRPWERTDSTNVRQLVHVSFAPRRLQL